jgi:hypothetical protein
MRKAPAPPQAFGLYVDEVSKRGLLDAAKDLLFAANPRRTDAPRFMRLKNADLAQIGSNR